LPANTETWVWNLHPGAALDALEELGQARLKHHDILMGVVIIPKSLRPEWFRHFIKIVDLYFFIPAGAIEHVKLLPLPQPPLRARTDARKNPSAQRATQLRSVLACVYAVSR
jgi:hypothetical protein